MNSKPVNTETNMVENGHLDDGYAHWEDIGAPGGYVDLKSGEWGGQNIPYMSIYRGSGIGQKVPAPVRQSAAGRYRLSFLYDNRSAAAGSFVIRRQGTEDHLELLLPSTGNLAEPGISSLSLTLLTELIDFDVEQDDLFNIEIISPPEALATTDLVIARIGLHLELAPLVLAAIQNDGQVYIPDSQPCLYLCHGATGAKAHQLSFEAEHDSPWVGTEALLWSVDNPQEAVVVAPDWGDNQRLEEPWQVDCPEPLTNDTQLFNLFIYSKYHADPYPIAVSLGHHRLMVETCLEATYQPVIEYGQSVQLGVRVRSYYLDLPIRGHEVCWMLGDEVLFRDNTDEGGYAWFDFTPAIEGSNSIDARVLSPFYAQGSVAQTFNISAHATDPLKAVKIQFPEMEAASWGAKTGYPDRGATYEVSVLIPADSPLHGLQIWLVWEGTPAQELGVTVSPALLHPVPVGDAPLNWTLNCEDRLNGNFSLRLGCAELREPTVINPMLLARHSLKIGDVREANRVPVVEENDYVWCMLRVLSLADLPVAGVPVEWQTSHGPQRTHTGVNGWASVIDRPQRHGDYTLTARVNPREGGQVLSHDFAIRTQQDSSWKTAGFALSDVAVDRVGAGAVCRMGQRYAFHLRVEADSPLIDKEVALQWRDPASAGSIVIAGMESPTPITATGVTWSVEALVAETSGVFDLQVISTGIEELDLAFRLLPDDLSDEVTLVFDQAAKSWDTGVDLYPCIGATHDLTFEPTNDLGGLHGLLFETRLAPDVPSGWGITPSLTEPSAMSAGGVRYRCDFSGAAEAAERRWSVKVLGVDESYVQPSEFGLKLAHNKVVGLPFDVTIDPIVSKNESVRLALRYLSAFTGGPAGDVSVTWSDGGTSLTVSDGIAQHDYEPSMGGSSTVTASVNNLYDATRPEHTFTVQAHETDPWLDLKVQPASGEAWLWGERTFFPRRGDRLDLSFFAMTGSPLLNQALTLGLSGGHELDLDLSFGPVGLGQSRPLGVAGLPISLLAGDETNAAFSLQLSASRLLVRSPLNAVSLGGYEPVAVITPRRQDYETVDWGEQLSFAIVVTNTLTGRPAKNVQVQWESTDEAMEHAFTSTNFYGVTHISFIAKRPGSGRLTAGIVASAQVHEFVYHVNEACVIQDLTSPSLEYAPQEEISAEALVVDASTGEPVEGVKVHWFFKEAELEPVLTDINGRARIRFAAPSRIGRFVLSASVRGASGRGSARLIFNILASKDTWLGEFTFWLNGQEFDVENRPILKLIDGTDNVWEMRVRKDSHLLGKSTVALNVPPVAEPLGLVFDPPLNEKQPVTLAPLRWSIQTQADGFGLFQLELVSPDLPTRSLSAEVNVSES